MKVTVWHFDMRDPRFREHPMFMEPREAGEWPCWPKDYEKVAAVEVPEDRAPDSVVAAEFCFEATNHLTEEEPSYVKWVRPSRSTSSGDVVLLEDGRALVALSCGWQELNRAE